MSPYPSHSAQAVRPEPLNKQSECLHDDIAGPCGHVEWWHLRDGDPIVIRPVSTPDLPEQAAFFNGLSPATRNSWLVSLRQVTGEEARHLFEVGCARACALVASMHGSDPGQIVASARFFIDDSGERAECSVVVADQFQRSGLGRKLLVCLIEAARHRGLRQLLGITHSSNRAMLTLARRRGFVVAKHGSAPGLRTLTLKLRQQSR